MTPVVLILESVAELRRMLEDGLQQGGYAVRVASDGEEALALMRRDRVDLVLIDPPSPDGNEEDPIVDEIHEAFPDVPSIVLVPNVLDLASLLADAGGDYRRQRIGCPFTLRSLLAAVHRATGGSQPDRP